MDKNLAQQTRRDVDIKITSMKKALEAVEVCRDDNLVVPRSHLKCLLCKTDQHIWESEVSEHLKEGLQDSDNAKCGFSKHDICNLKEKIASAADILLELDNKLARMQA